jgi:hypothetical protein
VTSSNSLSKYYSPYFRIKSVSLAGYNSLYTEPIILNTFAQICQIIVFKLYMFHSLPKITSWFSQFRHRLVTFEFARSSGFWFRCMLLINRPDFAFSFDCIFASALSASRFVYKLSCTQEKLNQNWRLQIYANSNNRIELASADLLTKL